MSVVSGGVRGSFFWLSIRGDGEAAGGKERSAHRAGFAGSLDVDAGAAGLRGIGLGDIGIHVHIDAGGADEAKVLADAVLRLRSQHRNFLIHDGQARELVCASTLIGTSDALLKSSHRL